MNICERCGKPVERDERILDYLMETYPDRAMCQRCALQIDLNAIVAREAAIEQITPREYLEQWLKQYE